MPTGYTDPLYKGEQISFEQFVLRCARGMGAAIMQRDEELDVEIRDREVAEYYYDRVNKAQRKLSDALNRGHADWQNMQNAEINEARNHRREYLDQKAAIEIRYKAMLDEVRAWVPPTADHEGLRRFMLEQLEQSLEFDCGKWAPAVPEETTVELYSERKIADAAAELTRAQKSLDEERERAASQSKWVKDLRDSLGIKA